MAATLAITFIAFAIVGRVLVQIYTTGNHGIRLANPKTEPVAAAAGAAFVLSFVVSLIIVALDSTHVWPISRFELALLNEVGLLVGLIGIAIVVVAQLQMGRAWRIGVDPSEATNLITHGFYRRSRNPIYFGLGLYWVGFCLLLPHPVIWGLAALCWLSIETIVRRVEEPYLRQLHGPDFDSYVQRSNRYLIW